MQLMDWQTVAHISRLTILNRVAFSMLFFVPLLSGFLRPVRVSVDKANAAIAQVESKTENARDIAEGAQALAEVTTGFREKFIPLKDEGDEEQPLVRFASAETPVRVASNTARRLDGWFEWNINTPFLPRPWALAFVAALLILAADTVFQIWCPQYVKQGGLEDYVSRQCEGAVSRQ